MLDISFEGCGGQQLSVGDTPSPSWVIDVYLPPTMQETGVVVNRETKEPRTEDTQEMTSEHVTFA
jgi:hypothetical protein